jgi:hypothetical protein
VPGLDNVLGGGIPEREVSFIAVDLVSALTPTPRC